MPENPTILVVDDEEVVRVALADILDMYGYRVITAAGGHEALRIVADMHPDSVHLAILDLMMPGIDGFETMRRLIALDPNTRIIISSGYDETEAHERFQLGEYDRTALRFLQKPYPMAEIMKLVRSCLAGYPGRPDEATVDQSGALHD